MLVSSEIKLVLVYGSFTNNNLLPVKTKIVGKQQHTN